MLKLDGVQEADVQRLLSNRRWGLFHAMGVGKTPPAIVAGANTPGPILVTVPAYLIPQWILRIREWVPDLDPIRDIARADGDGKVSRGAAFDSNAKFVLTSYNNWAPKPTNYPQLHKKKWGAVILDEGHRIRGYKSQWTQRIWQLDNSDCKNRGIPIWNLTGTFLVRDGGDAYPWMHLADRGVYKSYWTFVETWCHLAYSPWSTEIGPLKDPEGFYRMLSGYSNRRILTGLEEPEIVPVPVELPQSVRGMITKAKRDFRFEHPDLDDPIVYDGAGAVWGKIREMVTNPPTQKKPKLDALDGLLEDIPNERVIVYTWFRASARAAFERAVKKRGEKVVAMFTGDQRTSEKIAALEMYNATPNGVIVATIAALKEGSDLQAGHHMIFLEESELPSDNWQAVGRQLRRGQTKKVVVHWIYADRSIDGAVHSLATKRDEDQKRVMLQYLSQLDY